MKKTLVLLTLFALIYNISPLAFASSTYTANSHVTNQAFNTSSSEISQIAIPATIMTPYYGNSSYDHCTITSDGLLTLSDNSFVDSGLVYPNNISLTKCKANYQIPLKTGQIISAIDVYYNNESSTNNTDVLIEVELKKRTIPTNIGSSSYETPYTSAVSPSEFNFETTDIASIDITNEESGKNRQAINQEITIIPNAFYYLEVTINSNDVDFYGLLISYN